VHDYGVHFYLFRVGCCMAARPKETTIERIYREVTGNKMPAEVKRILLRKRKVKRHYAFSICDKSRLRS
jgi:hypothetical protein